MPVTIAEIARRAGVSKTTVSRVLNGKPDVDRVTADRIRRVVAETGYIRNSRAVGLARGRTATIGVLVPSLGWPWMGELLEGTVEEVEGAGYGLLLSTAARSPESLDQFAGQVSGSAFDGLLMVVPPDAMDFAVGLFHGGLPVVLIDDRGQQADRGPGWDADQRTKLPSVGTTNRAGGEQAAQHLLESGRIAPAMVTGPSDFGAVAMRTRGFLERYAAEGAEPDPRLVVASDFTEPGGYEATRRLLATRLRFDSVFAQNDLMAAGVLRALRSAGRRVPDDVAVVGFDDIPMAAHTDPPLTTIRQPCHEMGATAARILLDHLAGAPMPDAPAVLPTSVVARRSAPIAGG